MEDPALLKRVAHHEAAHAVTLVVRGFTLRESFLTRGTTLDGTLGGYTGWTNPLADPRRPATADDYEEHARNVAVVLYAGQCAERVLAEHDDRVRLPDNEPNWQTDDAEAAALLVRAPLNAIADAESAIRSEALELVRSVWHIIVRVARALRREVDVGAGGLAVAGYVPSNAVLRGPDVAQYLRPLDAQIHDAFVDDNSVLRHEMGHFVTWFLYGGGIGPLRLTRRGDGKLRGAVLFGPRSPQEQQRGALVDEAADRLLAGEVAARQYLGLCDWQMSTGDPLTAIVRPDKRVDLVGNGVHADLTDLRKVFDLAEAHHSADWWPWLERRLLATRTLLRERAEAIAALTAWLQPSVPRKRGEWRFTGTDLIRWGYEVGLRPADRDRPPVELVPDDFRGGACVSLRRWWRSWGTDATPHQRVEPSR